MSFIKAIAGGLTPAKVPFTPQKCQNRKRIDPA
jgi:hypothetical protein